MSEDTNKQPEQVEQEEQDIKLDDLEQELSDEKLEDVQGGGFGPPSRYKRRGR